MQYDTDIHVFKYFMMYFIYWPIFSRPFCSQYSTRTQNPIALGSFVIHRPQGIPTSCGPNANPMWRFALLCLRYAKHKPQHEQRNMVALGMLKVGSLGDVNFHDICLLLVCVGYPMERCFRWNNYGRIVSL